MRKHFAKAIQGIGRDIRSKNKEVAYNADEKSGFFP